MAYKKLHKVANNGSWGLVCVVIRVCARNKIFLSPVMRVSLPKYDGFLFPTIMVII